MAGAAVADGESAAEDGFNARLRGETVKVLNGSRGHDAAGGGGTGDGGKGEVDIREERVGEFVYLVQAVLGEEVFLAGTPGEPAGEECGGKQKEEGGGGGGREGAIALEKEAETVGRGVRDGGDGLELEVVAEIRGELGGGLVAFGGIAAKRAEEDCIEIAGKFAAEEGGRAIANSGDEGG